MFLLRRHANTNNVKLSARSESLQSAVGLDRTSREMGRAVNLQYGIIQ